MRNYPAIAVIEFAGIADGIYCTDALLKKAPIAMIKSGTVSGGRYLIIIGGSTASVEESLNEALTIGHASRLDHAFLPHAHPQVHDAVLGRRQAVAPEAIAILETDTVAANVRAAEAALKGAALWNEVSNRLNELGANLSGGQQQRLCIARALASDPEIILFDEPTSALDPIATASIEELVTELKEKVTILIVTHNMQQAARISDFTAYMYLGEMVEFGVTDQIFIKPTKKATEDYITGRFG